MTRSAPGTIAMEHAADRAPRHSVQRLVRRHIFPQSTLENSLSTCAAGTPEYVNHPDIGKHEALLLVQKMPHLRVCVRDAVNLCNETHCLLATRANGRFIGLNPLGLATKLRAATGSCIGRIRWFAFFCH